MGSRGASSGRGGAITSASMAKIMNETEKIRNAKKENLIVFDKNGNILYTEGGTLSHTGYGNADDFYKDSISVHNHPKGVAPFPSDTDFDTFQNKGIDTMVIVSPDYTITVKADPNYSGVKSSISKNMQYTGFRDADNALRKLRQSGQITQKEYNQKRREIKFKYQAEACKRSGYTMTVEPTGKKKK